VSSARLTIPITGRTVTDPWWIRMEQEAIEDDSATVTEAANLVDTLYGLSACETTDGLTDLTDPDTETTDAVVETTISSVACSFDQDANVDLILRVYRSNPSEEYILRLQGGSIKTAETIRATITSRVAVENASSITLDSPILGSFSASWAGPVYGSSGSITPALFRVGNTIDFGGVTVKSGTLIVTYATEYDRCTVTVDGVDGEPGECTARAFFHGLVDELDLEVPGPAEELGSCQTRWVFKEIPDRVECYRTVYVSKKCQCDHEEIDHYMYDEVVECPNPDIRCPGALDECRHFLGTVVADEYVYCSGEEPDQVADPDYYERMCCKRPDVPLPRCSERITTWRGGKSIDGGVQLYRDLYGHDVEIVPVSPPGGICGTWTLKQDVSNDCCLDVDPLAYDTDNSADLITSAGIVYITGGEPPFTWAADRGLTFDNGEYEVKTTGRAARVHLPADPCGSYQVTIRDICGQETEGIVRADAGEWQLIEDTLQDTDWNVSCVEGGMKYVDDWCTAVCEENCGGTGTDYCSDPNSGGAPDPCRVEGNQVWQWGCES